METQKKRDECFKYFIDVVKSKSLTSLILMKELERLWKEVYWGE